MKNRALRFDPMRAPACDRCRGKKRKCDSHEPCSNCSKAKAACLYSRDGRHKEGRGRTFPSSNGYREDDRSGEPIFSETTADTVVGFYSGADPADSSVTSQKDISDVLRGGIHQAGIFSSECKFSNGQLNYISKSNSTNFALDKSTCNLFIERFRTRRVASHVVIGPDFDYLYQELFSESDKTLTGGSLFLIYSALAIGSLDNNVATVLVKDLPDITACLYRAASDCVTSAIIESSLFSSLGFYVFGHMCNIFREPLSQRRFTEIGTGIAITCGYHREVIYRNIQSTHHRESRLRSFWHGYTVGYLHAALCGLMPCLPLDAITAPHPNPEIKFVHDIDGWECFYLQAKIHLVQIHHRSLIRDPTVAQEEHVFLLKSLDHELSQLSESITSFSRSGPNLGSYAMHCQYLVECVRISIYRPMLGKSYYCVSQVDATARKLIRLIWHSVFVKEYGSGSQAWYVSNFTFFAAVMILVAERVTIQTYANQLDGQPAVAEEIKLASEIFSELRHEVPGVSAWDEIIGAYRSKKVVPIEKDRSSNISANKESMLPSTLLSRSPSGFNFLPLQDYDNNGLDMSLVGSLEEFLFSAYLD